MTPRTARKLGLCLLASSVALLVASPARADRKADAAAAAQRGDHLLGKGDYAGALTELRDSYGKYPKPYLLFRIAECEEKLGRDADALADYKKYLDKVTHGPDRKKALASVAVLQPKVDAAAAAAAAPPPPPPPQPVQQANDSEAPPIDDQEVAAARKRKLTGETTATAPKVEAPPPGYDPNAPPPPEPSARQEPLPPGEHAPLYRRWWPWTIAAAGVAVGVGLGVGLGLGLPRFHSELPVGGPGAARVLTVRF